MNSEWFGSLKFLFILIMSWLNILHLPLDVDHCFTHILSDMTVSHVFLLFIYYLVIYISSRAMLYVNPLLYDYRRMVGFFHSFTKSCNCFWPSRIISWVANPTSEGRVVRCVYLSHSILCVKKGIQSMNYPMILFYMITADWFASSILLHL